MLSFGFPATPGEAQPLDFIASAEPNTYFQYLETDAKGAIRSAEIIAFPIATYNSDPYVLSAEIVNDRGQCIARRVNFVHNDNAIVLLKRDDCLQKGSWSARIKLILKAGQSSRFALWGSQGDPLERKENSVIASIDEADQKVFYVQGNFSERTVGQPLNRSHLLSFLWGWSSPLSAGTILIVAFLATLLMLILLKPYFFSNRFWMTCFAFSLFTSLGALYAFIVPPLQAPDEPDHLLSYMRLTGSAAMEHDFLNFAQKNHFERIKFHPNERFTGNDTVQPFVAPFAGHVGDSDISNRSPSLTAIWKIVSPSFQNLPIGTHIFALRILNVLICAFLFALAIRVFSSASEEGEQSTPETQMFVWIFLFCLHPITFFFSMHVSNYSLTLAFGLLGSMLLQGALKFAQKRPFHFIFLLGVCLMGMFSSSTSGISYLGFWLPFLILFPAYSPFYGVQRSGRFLLLLSSLSGLLFITVCGFFVISKSFSSESLNNPLFWQLNKGGISLVFVLLLPLFACMHLLLKKLCNMFNLRFYLRIVHGTVGLLICAGMVFPLFFLPHRLPNIEQVPIPLQPIQYSMNALKVMTMNLGLGAVDFYLSSSFWGGIGWLESNFDNWFVVLSRSIVSLGVIIHFFLAHVFARIRLMLFNLSVVVSLASMLGSTAFMTSKIPVNLHGRYLIPFYLLLIGFSACGYLRLLENLSDKGKKLAFISLMTVSILFHLYGISHVLERYFG